MTREALGAGDSGTAAHKEMWSATLPIAWPTPPAVMSYSVLRDIETCPLRWSLRRAEYARIWSKDGYPTAPPLATFDGQVVHVTLERILLEATRASLTGDDLLERADESCRPPSPLADVIGALRRLGGVTAVLERVLDTIVSEWADNPRLAPRAHEWEIEMRRRLPVLRQRVQSILARADLSRGLKVDSKEYRGAHRWNDQKDEKSQSRPLGPGVYPEVPLRYEAIGWKGRADLLVVQPCESTTEDRVAASDHCSIIDFKTGAAKEDHALQLRIYALLWAHDQRLNPTGRRVSELVLIYADHTVRVTAPATDAELTAIAEELRERTEMARCEASKTPPVARPSETACEWCDVRHLCSAYWSSADVEASASTVQKPSTDVEIRVIARQSPTSWIAEVLATPITGTVLRTGNRVLVRTRQQDVHFISILSPGIQLRVLGAQRLAASDESSQLPVLGLTRSSEAFVLHDSNRH